MGIVYLAMHQQRAQLKRRSSHWVRPKSHLPISPARRISEAQAWLNEHAKDVNRRVPPAMVPSRAATLFVDKADPGPSPATFVLSIFVHGLALAVIWFCVVYKPPFARVSNDHLTVRQIDLRTPEEEQRAAAAQIPYPASAPAAPHPANNSRPRLPVLRQMTEAKPGPQTILQPELLNTTALSEKIPVPQVMIWSPSKTIVKKVEPPLPQKPTAADVKPVVKPPNQEINLADVNVSAAIEPAKKSLFKPSTTSPVAVHVPQAVQAPPASASQSTQQPTPAAILSLSDLRSNGTTMLPPVNESDTANSPGVLTPGQQNAASSQNGAAPAAPSAANGAGQGSATKADNSNSGPAAEAGKPNVSPSPAGSGTSTDASASPSSTQIALPKDGHFGAVIVGEALQEKFPEISGVWGGRLAYTAYLHVGLAKSWILQYSLPSSADASAGGTIARLQAPWPYNIVRPNLPSGSIDADALMIHGFVNQSGRFETLSVVFPQPFADTQFVLAALQQWQFRPATQDGQSAKVEILLIIPEDLD